LPKDKIKEIEENLICGMVPKSGHKKRFLRRMTKVDLISYLNNYKNILQ